MMEESCHGVLGKFLQLEVDAYNSSFSSLVSRNSEVNRLLKLLGESEQ